MLPAWQAEGRTIAWPHGEAEHFQLPFVYSCNGRPYLKQLAEQSGTWFRDLRDHLQPGAAPPGPSTPRKACSTAHRRKQGR
jgi:type I restriction enzyme, R subunit